MKNYLIIGLVVVVLFLAFSMFGKESEPTGNKSRFEGTEIYGDGEPTNWGTFAQAIKTHTKIPNQNGTPMEVYSSNVDIVRGWFKRNNIKPKGSYVLRFKNDINQYIASDGLPYTAF